MKKLIYIALIFCFGKIHAQDSFKNDTSKQSPSISWSGYADAYFAYYTDSVGDGNYQKFPSVSPRSNQFGLNVAALTAQYDAERVRGLVCVHFGDIPKSTWSGSYNNIMEAHAGVRLQKKLWLDAGFFRTHIGAEGLFPKENIASSIAIGTYMEPYFQAGVKLNYNATKKLALNLFILNGYNIFEDNNDKKSVGILATYAFNDNCNIGYNNYVGDDTPTSADSISHLRVYNNLFVNYQKGKLKFQLGGDYARQQNADTTGKKSASMMSALVSVKYKFCKNFSLYTRGELFNDPQGFLSGVMIDKYGKSTGLKLWGATLGAEYTPTDNSYIRLEGRQLQCDANQEIFRWGGVNKSNRMEIMVHMGVSF